MKNSLEKLLKKFPVFLDKRKDSNFTRSEKVFNEWFKDMDNDLFQIYVDSRLSKPVMIWKEQSEPYNYKIHFLIVLDNINCVTLMKNDNVIYTKTYEEDETVNYFYYAYTDESLNIIPDDTFSVKAYTADEYVVSKSFPDEIDESLDNIGALSGVHRRHYREVSASEYENTIPPYNDQLVEDDFHYMQRIMINNLLYHNTPAPLLTIWNELGVIGEISNRQNTICRMSMESEHLDINGGYDPYWTPRPWEHKDFMCGGSDSDSLFLWVSVDNRRPVNGQNIEFELNPVNSYGDTVQNDDFVYVMYINGKLYVNADNEPVFYHSTAVNFNTSQFNDKYNTIQFKLYSNVDVALTNLSYDNGMLNVLEDDIVSKPLLIEVVGCDDGKIFVSNTGDDNNPGTRTKPFLTIDKAFTKLTSEDNIITVLDGGELHNTQVVKDNVYILSCNKNMPTINCSVDHTFIIKPDTWLNLRNIRLKHNCCYNNAVDFKALNKSRTGFDLNVRFNSSHWCKILSYITLTDYTPVYADEPVEFVVKLLKRADDTPITTEQLEISVGDNKVVGTAPYSYSKTFNSGGVFPVKVVHNEDDDYCRSLLETSIIVYHLLRITASDTGVLEYETSKEDLNLILDEDGNLKYVHDSDTSTIKLLENGDIEYAEEY